MSGRSRRPRAVLWSAQRDGHVLRLGGEIDIANAEAVRDQVVAEICSGVDELDLSGVGFYGVAGLEALLYAHAVLRSQGRILRLTCSPMVVRTLQVCGLTQLEGLIVTTIDKPGSDDGEGAGQ